MRVHRAARSGWWSAFASAMGLALGRRVRHGCCRTRRLTARSCERASARAIEGSSSTRTRCKACN
eukprot:1822084-Pleurochrysis_carterae.AAC.1